ncbi:MAG: NUDIX domain-containing protein [Firmicutes bacterium]|nr:NUDIX domain-containing protein [Bacillota bacterium]
MSDIFKIKLGKKENHKYGFRETCFGICIKNGKIYLLKRHDGMYLIGGGLEKNETKEECIKREFLEEVGVVVSKLKEFCIIDCYWLTVEKQFMRSLANIFIVEVTEEIEKSAEVEYELELVDLDLAENLLPLPYHKEAVRLFKARL